MLLVLRLAADGHSSVLLMEEVSAEPGPWDVFVGPLAWPLLMIPPEVPPAGTWGSYSCPPSGGLGD